MQKPRRKLGQRHHHKLALMKSWMRQRQELRVARLVSIEKKINVDRSRTLGHVACSSERFFHFQKPPHDFFRFRKGTASQLRDHVEKGWLCKGFHRLGLIDA